MNKQRTLFLAFAAAATVGSGLMHGHLNQRWGVDTRLKNAAAQLQTLPKSFGDWHESSNKELSKTAIEMLQCAGYINKIYVNQQTNEQMSVVVMVGPGATMAIHTPEICYSGRNFSMVGEKRHSEISDAGENQHQFWLVDFTMNDTQARELRVHYGWSDGGTWQAPNRPRLAFAGKRLLYKIQIAEYMTTLQKQLDDRAERFLREFLLALHETIGAARLSEA